MRMIVVTRETAGGSPTKDSSAGISVFESAEAPADPVVLSAMDKSLEGMDLAAPPVVLPDFHHKPHLEMPSSIAVATRHSIRPTLTSAAVNCGMALVAFDASPPSEKAVTEFFTRVRERLPEPAGNRRDLTAEEVVRCALDGAHFAADRYGIDSADLRNIEEGGRLDLDHLGGIARARRQLPRLLVELSRMRFGIIGASNHFIELQRVEEIYDADAARQLGIAEGQLTLQYHGGGGILTGVIGRLFGRREDYPLKHRAIMAFQKPVHHLASARSMTELRTRLALYFSDGAPPVTRESPEGERLLLANAVAMNYGFAFRLATYAALRELGREILGLRSDHLVVELARRLDVRGGAQRRDRHGASPQLVAGVSCLAHEPPSCVRGDRAAGAPARHQPHLVIPLRRQRGCPCHAQQHEPRHRHNRLQLRAQRSVAA